MPIRARNEDRRVLKRFCYRKRVTLILPLSRSFHANHQKPKSGNIKWLPLIMSRESQPGSEERRDEEPKKRHSPGQDEVWWTTTTFYGMLCGCISDARTRFLSTTSESQHARRTLAGISLD